MKSLLSTLVIFISLLLSCTNENIENTEIPEGNIFKDKAINAGKMATAEIPKNPANPYDIAGKIHNDILDAYLAGDHIFSTIAQITQKIDSISALNDDLSTLAASSPIIPGEIQQIIDNPQTALEQAIASSGMSPIAKDSLSGFMASIVLWEANEYSVIHESIVSFEASVLSNAAFSNEEKRIILTTCSITRYAIYYNKKRKDKDWETSVGNRVGAVQGAIANSSSAIKRSIIAGIIIQNLQTP